MPKKSGGSISGPAQEPKVQSKTNPALSYGRASGKTYINKGAPLKPKRGATSLEMMKAFVKIQKIANAQSKPMTIQESALRNPTKRGR